MGQKYKEYYKDKFDFFEKATKDGTPFLATKIDWARNEGVNYSYFWEGNFNVPGDKGSTV